MMGMDIEKCALIAFTRIEEDACVGKLLNYFQPPSSDHDLNKKSGNFFFSSSSNESQPDLKTWPVSYVGIIHQRMNALWEQPNLRDFFCRESVY